MTNWIKVQNIEEYIKSGDYVSDKDSYALCRSLYHAKGKKYPLLHIAIHANPEWSVSNQEFTGFKFGISYKEEQGGWWQDHHELSYLPLSIIDDFQVMLTEAVKKVSKE